jgi:hypothetical protein
VRGEAGGSPRQAIVIADQNFPAVLPVDSHDQCFKIIRVESGSLKVLVDTLLDHVGNRVIPPGSLVLIGSLSHLANVGLSAYVYDLLDSVSTITSKLGREVRVSPLPPMMMSGIDSGQVIREVFELATWAEAYFPNDVFLSETTAAALEEIKKSGEGSQSYMEPKRVRLPASTGLPYTTWHSGGPWVNSNSGPLPYSATALQQPEEKTLVTTMIAEIREKHAIDLDPSPAFERGLGGKDRPRQAIDFAIVGSSHASKVSAALERQGFSCELVYTSNWRVSPSAVEDMHIRLKEVVREKDPTTNVFHMLDNSTYYGRTEDGSCFAPRRGDDGIYHVEGEVYLCGRDTLLQHFNTIKPLLDLTNKRRGIVISPMPRYTQAGCCSEPDLEVSGFRAAAEPGHDKKAPQRLPLLRWIPEHPCSGSLH